MGVLTTIYLGLSLVASYKDQRVIGSDDWEGRNEIIWL